jgi:acyl-CoA synthetase (AMP-forming)/AMP-acid ligase II
VVAPAYAMDESTVNIVAMPLFHVGGTSWALGSMSAGGRTIIVREPVPGALPGLIEFREVTHAYFAPAMVQTLLADPARARSALRSLKVLAYGGSPLPAPHPGLARPAVPGRQRPGPKRARRTSWLRGCPRAG